MFFVVFSMGWIFYWLFIGHFQFFNGIWRKCTQISSKRDSWRNDGFVPRRPCSPGYLLANSCSVVYGVSALVVALRYCLPCSVLESSFHTRASVVCVLMF